MAEVVRGGLQAIPKGQFEGAMALGLGYWNMMRLIILPQALRISIPSSVEAELCLRTPSLVTNTRLLRQQMQGRVRRPASAVHSPR